MSHTTKLLVSRTVTARLDSMRIRDVVLLPQFRHRWRQWLHQLKWTKCGSESREWRHTCVRRAWRAKRNCCRLLIAFLFFWYAAFHMSNWRRGFRDSVGVHEDECLFSSDKRSIICCQCHTFNSEWFFAIEFCRTYLLSKGQFCSDRSKF